MLIIRSAQLQALEDRQLEQAALDRAPRFFPELCRGLGKELGPTIRKAVRKARGYGFAAQSDALQFVYLALLFGGDFDQDPNLPWAQRVLSDKDPAHRPFRASRLYESALRHLRAEERRAARGRQEKTR
ncbi:MAG TPA: hypothetical protein VML19_23825 [Verrucomicrobiae bacterium]|nr:hypothetical protein [Verrucomicrobiae bacterium]